MSYPGASPVLGIDLGTYNSAAAVLLDDRPVLLRPEEGATDQGACFPSFVEFDERGEFLRAGELARRAAQVHPERVVWGVKRLIGKSYRQARQDGDLARFQYRIVKGPDGGCRIQVGRRDYSPADVSRLVLEKVKRDCEAPFNPLGTPVAEAVITVPAYFGPLQKAETERAAVMAGFDKVRLIPEPTAAALAYNVHVDKHDQYIAVIDLGAGTLDVTVALLYLDDQGTLRTEEKGHGGDIALGGLDMDAALVQHVAKAHGLRRAIKDPQTRAKLTREIERAKIALSTDREARVAFASPRGDVELALTRDEVEAAVRGIVDRCRGPVRIALREAGLGPRDVSHVLLVGGPTRMPLVRRMVKEEFAANPRVVQEIRAIERDGPPVNPMEAVARGAVLGAFGGITPHAYGIQLGGAYYELIPRRQRYPCTNAARYAVRGSKRSMLLSLLQKAVDPRSCREVYTMLGVFEFDYRPEPGEADVQVEAEYTDNGVLNLRVLQPSTMIELPLYGVSKLEGRRVARPPAPLPVGRPTATPPGGDAGPPGHPDGPAPRAEEWSENDLKDAVRAGNALLPVAEARLGRASDEEQDRIREIADDLREAIANTWEAVSIRTPQIRNLTRALLNALLASRLIDRQELRELQRGLR